MITLSSGPGLPVQGRGEERGLSRRAIDDTGNNSGAATPFSRAHLTAHANDNVTTVLDNRTDLTVLTDGGPVAAGVPFGHKVARVAIPAGADIVKYNVVIGQATRDIEAGEHVHVDNCR
jgi:hypothetical protein